MVATQGMGCDAEAGNELDDHRKFGLALIPRTTPVSSP